jgi:DNA mismatch repair protein MutS2
VRRILADLTALVREQADAVGATFEAVTEFDLLAAKARFGHHYRCTQPRLSDGEIELRQARHPILLFNERQVTPIDVHLPADKSALVITGPNTGGKTVALKTVGLLSLLAQSGLLIPAEDGSRLPCWSGVFADVGDEQNIQRNLSTFSAHIANLVDIERTVEPPALVLLDEPGVGTDPEEGAALAIGLLETIPSRRVRVIATTHYTPVKLYALTHERCVVAAVDFDLPTLAPKYRLLYHSLGESLALPIAEQLGLSSATLNAARGALSEQTRTVQAALAKLEETRRGYEERRADIEGREQSLGERERESATLLDELQTLRREKWRTELATARQFVRDLKNEGREVLAQLRAAERDFQAAPRRGAEAESAQVLESFVERAMAAMEQSAAGAGDIAPASFEPVHVGDQVEIAGGGFRGELLSVSGERAWIRRGTMRVEVPAEKLRRVAGEESSPAARLAAPTHGLNVVSREGSPHEVTLIGLRAREALSKLETALDRAALAGFTSVRVVHGKGSGALRRAVQEYLQLSPYCARFRDGANEEGGTGVTIVELGG